MARLIEWPEIFFVFDLRCGRTVQAIKDGWNIDDATVSSRIKTLETEYGAVFLRAGRNFDGLTRDGETLRVAVTPILAAWQELFNLVKRRVSIRQVLAALAVEETGSMSKASELLYGIRSQVHSIHQLLDAFNDDRSLFVENARRDNAGSTPTQFDRNTFVGLAWEFIDACVDALTVAPRLYNTTFRVQLEQASILINRHRELDHRSTINATLQNSSGQHELF